MNVFPDSALEPEQTSMESDAPIEPWAPPASSSPREPAWNDSLGIDERPPATAVDPKAPYRSASYEHALQELLAAIRAGSGAALVTAPVGMGKTTLCLGLAQEVDRRTMTFLVSEPPQSFDDLLRTMLVGFGVMAPPESVGHAPVERRVLMSTLDTFLESLPPLQAIALVVIDEAHRLRADALVDLQALLAADGPAQRELRLVLAGEPALITLFAHPDLQDLNARIAVRIELGPLAEGDLPGYLARRLSLSGGRSRRQFDEAAAARIFDQSAGVPRLVNLLADRALALARETATPVIDAKLVDAAADINRTAPTGRSRLVSSLFIVAAFAILILAGGAGALWLWRDAVSRAIVEWQNIPAAPRSPVRNLPAPAAPIPPPAIVDNPPRRPIM